MSPAAAVEHTVFQDIYGAVLDAYRQNGGNGAEAIRAACLTAKASGVSYAREAVSGAVLFYNKLHFILDSPTKMQKPPNKPLTFCLGREYAIEKS